MTLQQSALRQGRPAGGRNIRCWNYFGNDNSRFMGENGRGLANKSIQDSQLKEALAREHVKDLENREKAKKKAKALDKDFFISVLGSSATKREARSYIQRFTPSEEIPSATATAKPAPQSQPCGVNLGGFYGPAAVTRSPKFVQQPEKLATDTAGPQLHVALVKIRAPQTLDHITLDGIGQTLAQLARLGLVSIVVVDCNNSGPPSGEGISNKDWKTAEIEQANRLIAAIDANGDTGARLADNIIGVSEEPARPGFRLTRVHVSSRNLLMVPLRRNIIPVIPSIAYSDAQQIAVPVLATDVVLALTRELAGLSLTLSLDDDLKVSQTKLHDVRSEASLDRLIVLDPLGGVPSTDRDNGYHVFLNMEQEFEPTKQDLLKGLYPQMDQSSLKARAKEESSSDLGLSNLLSKFVELGDPKPSVATPSEETTAKPKAENWYHLQNLQLVRGVLSMLPTSSSALLTTPEEAANSSNDAPFQAARVGTRRQRNPLIHNLLTDKPVFSSSLPVGRLSQQTSATENLSPAESIIPTTFAKHGMSVSIFPDPSISPWQTPIPGQPKLTLTDSAIDLPRLVHLIEDSFGRKLDVQGYLNRVNSRIAGVIIAGEYEGGALLTWETPPGVPDDGLPSTRARMVPYLDKFAVLKRAQGSGGVADLIFNAMVRDCFPQGCVWRSRRNNPVNKWYFERSRGTWKVPETGWTMFWTTPDLSLDRQRFGDYEGVCKSIEPSWADNKQVLD